MRALHTLSLVCALSGCGDLFSSLPPDDESFDAPIDGLNGAQLKSFFAGDEVFAGNFTVESGLGPVFNAPSCNSCHPGNGRGDPLFHLVRFGRGDPLDPKTFDPLVELGGPQLQDRAIAGYVPEKLPPGVHASLRTGPIVIGMGFLEALPAEAILSRADENDVDGDGISGRPNYVPVPSFIEVGPNCSCPGCKQRGDTCMMLGRFGRKAKTVSLLHQAVIALHEDIGITSDAIPKDLFNPQLGGPGGDVVPDPELPAPALNDLVFYLHTLRPPQRRNVGDPAVRRGEQVFAELGCTLCHAPALTSGPNAVEPLSNVTFHPYTDMLLHDMGDSLADNVPDGDATGREWRTTPLWGIGNIANLLGGRRFYLHDGSARTLDEAIARHGGEAKKPRDAFMALPARDHDALIAFLESL
jgi:CxxC motif-containing protein (DUF1111 family)